MKKPLYALLIAPDDKMREKILNGEKKISIREGYRNYQPGKMLLSCHIEPWAVMVDLVKVQHKILKSVTEEEYTADGFSSLDALLEGLREYYPDISPDSPVTILEWDNAEGKLVDEHKKAAK